MSDGVRADLEFDVSQALADIERLERALNQATTTFGTGLANSLRNVDLQVDVQADTGDVRDLQAGLEAAERAADGAEDEIAGVERATTRADRAASRLRDEWRALAPIIGGAAILAGLRAAVDAASDLEESGSKAAQVFGDAVGVVQEFAETSATSVGLARQEFLEFAGTFGNLFVSMGLAQQAAADLAPEIVQLGADLASFNNLGVDETLEKLRSGLVGEIEPLRQLGINFNAAQVEAKALELSLVDANGELDEGAKLQARWALITEQASTAAGDFARTSDGLANQQRILKAEFGNVAAEIGMVLLPVALELVEIARDDLLPVIRDLALDLVPALGGAFRAGVPLFRAGLEVLAAAAPAISALATALAAIPEPLLTAAVGGIALNRALGPVNLLLSGTTTGALGAGAALGGLGGRLRNVDLIARGAAAGGLLLVLGLLQEITTESERTRERLNEVFATRAEAAPPGLAGVEQQIDQTRGMLERLRRQQAERSADPLGAFFQRVTGAAGQAETEIEQYERRLGELIHTQEALNIAASRLDIPVDKVAELAEQLNVDLAQPGAASALVDAVEASNALGASAVTAASRLETVRTALDNAREPATGLALAYERLGFGADVVIEAFEVGGDRAAIFARLMRDTGLSMEELLVIEAEVEDSIRGLADTFHAQVPRIEGAFADLSKDGPQGLNDFLQAAEERLAATAEFQDNIAELIAAGADDLARAFLAAGPEAAAVAARQAAAIDRDELLRKERHFEDQKRREDMRVLQVEAFARRLNTTFSQLQIDELLAEEHRRAMEIIERLPADAAEAFRRFAGDVQAEGRSIGEALVAGLVEGMTAAQQAAVAVAVGVADETIRAVREAFEFSSPSRVFQRIGEGLVEGLVLGMGRDDPVRLAARELAGIATAGFDPGGSARPPAVAPGAGAGAPAAAAPQVASPVVIERVRDQVTIGPVISSAPERTAIEVMAEYRAAQTRWGRA